MLVFQDNRTRVSRFLVWEGIQTVTSNRKRTIDYHYLALCVYTLMEARLGCRLNSTNIPSHWRILQILRQRQRPIESIDQYNSILMHYW